MLLIILAVIYGIGRRRKIKRGGFGFEKYSKNGSCILECFTLLNRWDRQERSVWFPYDFSDRYDRWGRGSLITVLVRLPGSRDGCFNDPGDLSNYMRTKL